jgi:hypothetical protein
MRRGRRFPATGEHRRLGLLEAAGAGCRVVTHAIILSSKFSERNISVDKQ